MEKSTSKTKKTTTGTGSRSAAGSKAKSAGRPAQQEPLNEKLDEFLLDSIKDIYWAEKHLVKALGKLHKAATTQELKDAFEDHIAMTEEHVSRLDEVFGLLGKKPQGKKCEAMEGLTKEAETIIEETDQGSMTRDVALIMAAQKVEHYEIASYGGLTQLTRTMGLTEISDILAQTLAEEKETDQLLTDIAENHINIEAINGSEEEEED